MYAEGQPWKVHIPLTLPKIERDYTMEGKEEDVKLVANKYFERQPIGTAAQTQDKDYEELPPAPLFEPGELKSWSFYRAGIAEFVATFLFLYITILTVNGVSKNGTNKCAIVGIQGIAWAFGSMIFALVYCTAGISGGHINPVVTFGLFLARKLPLTRAVFYIIMQCLGAICGAGVVKGFQKGLYEINGGGANVIAHGYTKGDGLGAEIIGTFVLVHTVFSVTDAKRNARDSHVPILAPLPIDFVVFLVHLATIPITGTGINTARSLGAAIIYNKSHALDDHWVFWVGPFIGAALAAVYHQIVIRAIPFKSRLSHSRAGLEELVFLTIKLSSMWLSIVILKMFGLLSVILKILGLSETVFEVTRKDQNSSGNDPGRFTFNSSPMFVLGTAIVLLHIFALTETVFEVTRKDQNSSGNDEGNDPGRFTFNSSPMFAPDTAIVLLHIFALTMGLIWVAVGGGAEASLGELVCCGWFLLTFWPFVRGLFSKGSYGIPWSVVVKAGVVVTVFLTCADWFRSV